MEINSVGQDTRGTATTLFFNSAGCALQPRSVQQKMMDYLLRDEEVGGYEVATKPGTVYVGQAIMLRLFLFYLFMNAQVGR